MILGFVLGPMLEENFRRALVLSEGDFSVFVREPISATFLALAVLILVLSALPRGRQRRSLIAEECRSQGKATASVEKVKPGRKFKMTLMKTLIAAAMARSEE